MMSLNQRDRSIKTTYHCGYETMASLASIHKLSRSRIQQIVRNPLKIKRVPFSKQETRDRQIRKGSAWMLKGLKWCVSYFSGNRMCLSETKGEMLIIQQQNGVKLQCQVDRQMLDMADIEEIATYVIKQVHDYQIMERKNQAEGE